MASPRVLRRIPKDDLPFTINLRRVNLGVGYTALLLPVAVGGTGLWLGTCEQNLFLDSISHYFYSPLGGSVFIGALTVIGTLLLFFYSVPAQGDGVAGHTVDEYLAFRWYDLWLARIAGVAALVIAFVPTPDSGCVLAGDAMRAYLIYETPPLLFPNGVHVVPEAMIAFDFFAALGMDTPRPDPHGVASGVMFLILAYFSMFVFTRVQSDKSVTRDQANIAKKKIRNAIYRVSGGVILLSIAAIGYKYIACPGPELCRLDTINFTFAFEALSLVAFAASWLTKGRFIRWLADEDQDLAA